MTHEQNFGGTQTRTPVHLVANSNTLIQAQLELNVGRGSEPRLKPPVQLRQE